MAGMAGAAIGVHVRHAQQSRASKDAAASSADGQQSRWRPLVRQEQSEDGRRTVGRGSSSSAAEQLALSRKTEGEDKLDFNNIGHGAPGQTTAEYSHDLNSDRYKDVHNHLKNNVDEEGRLRERTQFDKIRGCLSDVGIGLVQLSIVLNTASMGLAVSYPAHEEVWEALEHGFTVVFALEMVLKLLGQRLGYFRSTWNVFDFVVTWAAIFENWLLALGGVSNEAVGSLMIVRVFRLLRLARMFRVVRVSRELMVLTEGLVAALRSMIWIAALLSLVIYCSAVYFTISMSTDYDPSEMDVEDLFGSVPKSAVTLLALCLFDDFSSVVRPMSHRQPLLFLLLMAFLLIVSLGMLNLVVGVIADSTFRANHRTENDMLEAVKKQRMSAVYHLAHQVFDTDADHRLTIGELKVLAKNCPELVDHLRAIELPVGFRLEDLHLMFDQCYDQYLTRDEFINGMFRLLFSDDFQRNCVLQLNIAELKSELQVAIKTLEGSIQRQGIQRQGASEISFDKALSSIHNDNGIQASMQHVPKTSLTDFSFFHDLQERLDGMTRAIQEQLSGGTLPHLGGAARRPVQSSMDSFQGATVPISEHFQAVIRGTVSNAEDEGKMSVRPHRQPYDEISYQQLGTV